jgi:hypothetical protein
VGRQVESYTVLFKKASLSQNDLFTIHDNVISSDAVYSAIDMSLNTKRISQLYCVKQP